MRLIKHLLTASAFVLAISATAEAQQRKMPVRIGILTDMSGPFSDDHGMGSVAAAKLAIEDVGGSIGGYPVEVIFADMQNKVDVASTIAREWLDTKNVDVIMDVPFSPAALAVKDLVEQKDSILVTTAGTSMTGKRCNANTVQWAFNNYGNVKTVTQALSQAGAKSWFYITADYVFGKEMDEFGREFVKAAGGQVRGSVLHPNAATDLSSAVTTAIASGADVIGLANGGTDTQNSIKQLAAFGAIDSNQKIAMFGSSLPAVVAMGLQNTHGVYMPLPWYWNLNDNARAWTDRFRKVAEPLGFKITPSYQHASTFAFLTHMFKVLKTDPTLKGAALVTAMKKVPTDDQLFGKGELRVNGVHAHTYYLTQVKDPAESTSKFDVLKPVATVSGDDAFQPLAESGCALVQQAK